MGLDPVGSIVEEVYSPSDSRSFTPPPQNVSKFTQPILAQVSDITIPPNLQEILANVKRQESCKVDSYLPSKPSATFLTIVGSMPSMYQKVEKSTYSKIPMASKIGTSDRSSFASCLKSPLKETCKSTLGSLSDFDLIRKAEEELAAVGAVSISASASPVSTTTIQSQVSSTTSADPAVSPGLSSITDLIEEHNSNLPILMDSSKKNLASDQPKPPGLEDEDFPLLFPATMAPSTIVSSSKGAVSPKFIAKSGVVLCVKRKVNDDGSFSSSTKTPRTKSRWGQGPSG